MRGRSSTWKSITFACAAVALLHASPAFAAPPANDDFDQATRIANLPFTSSIGTVDATIAPDDPGCHLADSPSGVTVWYSFTPSTNTVLKADSTASDYDTTLSAYTGSRGALTQVACNMSSEYPQGRLNFGALKGVTYYIMVESQQGPGGSLTFSATRGTKWWTQRLDGFGGPNGRINAAIGPETASAVHRGKLHLFYYDETRGNLRHAYHNGTSWRFGTLDGAGGADGRINADVGSRSTAASFNGQLHVFAYDRTNGDLRHGWFDGAKWRFETLDGAGGASGRLSGDIGDWPSLQLWGPKLYVFYVDNGRDNVRRAVLTGTEWDLATLDGAGGTGGRINAEVGFNTATAAYGGRLHVFYFYQDPFCDPAFGCHIFGSVRHAAFGGAGWTFEDARRINCCFAGQSLATAKLSDTDVLVFFVNAGVFTGRIHAVRWDGIAWTGEGELEPADTFDGVGRGASALVFAGQPHVFYGGATLSFGEGLRDTVEGGAGWEVSVLGLGGAPTSSRVFSFDPASAPPRIRVFLGGGAGLVMATLL